MQRDQEEPTPAVHDTMTRVIVAVDVAQRSIQLGVNRRRLLEAFSELRSAKEAVAAVYKELQQEVREAEVELLDELGGRIQPGEIGQHSYYLGTVKKYKPAVDDAEAIDAVLESAGGDFAMLKQCLSKGCLKPSSVRGVLKRGLGEEEGASVFSRLFTVVVNQRVEVQMGRPVDIAPLDKS